MPEDPSLSSRRQRNVAPEVSRAKDVPTVERRFGEHPTPDDAVFDVVFEEGLLFFELRNDGSTPLIDLTTRLDRPVIGPDGSTDLAGLQVFRKVTYLRPGKTIRVFVDTAAGYFARRQPNLLRVELTWKQAGKPMSSKITHDVRVYRDLPFVVGHGERARRGIAVTDQRHQGRR